jgi:uncharacterized protein
MILPCLFIEDTTQKGRGVFTDEALSVDSIVEIAPVIILPKGDRAYVDKTVLHDYIFEWGDDATECCMALGYVPIYNHSYDSNCDYIMDYDAHTIMIKTVKEIAKGEELTINYNGHFNDDKKIWFDTIV